MDYLKAALSPQKQLAAEVIVSNDFATTAGGTRRTMEELAEEIGVSRQSLYNWMKEPAFTDYMAQISDSRLAQHRAKADAQLLRLIDGQSNNGSASIKSLELFYKLQSRLVTRTEVMTNNVFPQVTQAEIDANIDAMTARLKADAVEVIEVKQVE